MSGQLLVDNVSFGYPARAGSRRVEVLSQISFEVSAREVFAIVGPSGCGKTTLLHLIGGVLLCPTGSVMVDGVPVRGPGSDRVLITQEQSLFDWKTVLDNVCFGLKVRGMPRTVQIDTARRCLELVGLVDVADRYPYQLSGGMRQRAALARALAVEPSILLMDEPFGALDWQSRQELQERLLQVQRLTGHTTVVITHDVEEAVYLSDRIAILSSCPGRLCQILHVGLPAVRPPQIRFSSRFTEVKQHVHEQLRASRSR